jgi:hypothetical protein
MVFQEIFLTDKQYAQILFIISKLIIKFAVNIPNFSTYCNDMYFLHYEQHSNHSLVYNIKKKIEIILFFCFFKNSHMLTEVVISRKDYVGS